MYKAMSKAILGLDLTPNYIYPAHLNMSTHYSMSIKEGRAMLMAVRENLMMRIIARELLASWYRMLQLKYEKVIQFRKIQYEKVFSVELGDRIMIAWRKITIRNEDRRWYRMRDYVQSSSSSS